MDISLHSKVEQIIAQHIESGKFSTAADVIQTAILLLDMQERQSLPGKEPNVPAGPRRSACGILADLRSDIDFDEIKEARHEMWGDFPHGEP